MKCIQSLLIVLFPFHLTAQITITSADMPVVNDTMTVSIVDPTTVTNPEATGTNYTWDFSMLTPQQQRTDTFVDVSATPAGYQFYFNNNVLYPEHYSDYAVPVETPGFSSQINFEDVMYFYKNTSSVYIQTGFGSKINGVPASVRYQPTDTLYQFPLNYSDTDSNNYAFDMSVPGFGHYGQEGTRIDTVDGWGTITTPYGTYNALRVKSTLYKTDTIYIDSLGFGTTFNRPVEVEYKWLASGESIPVFKVTKQGNQITTAEYKDEFLGLGIDDHENDNTLSVYPNPTSDWITIESTSKLTSLEIYNTAGSLLKVISVSTGNVVKIDLGDFQNGFYIIKAVDREGEILHKGLIKRD